MEKPLVTLLLPCYNCEKTLDRFMRSVISESYRRWSSFALMTVRQTIRQSC